MLEGAGDFDFALQAQEDRARIGGQVLRQVLLELRKVERAFGDERGHAGAAVGAGHLHAVDIRFLDAREDGDRLGHFARRDVLALPAERVADAVDEEVVAERVAAQEVAGAEPGVALCEDVAQDFLLGVRALRVALEAAAFFVDHADRLAHLVGLAFDAEAVGSAHRLLVFDVEEHEARLQRVAHVVRNASDRTDDAVEIDERDVAFGRAVELDDARDAEARLEGRPDFGSEAVAHDDAQFVLALQRMRRRVQKIAAEFADVLELRCAVFAAIVPELGRRKLAADDDGTADRQRRADRADAARRVIERQHDIHAVALRRFHGGGEGMHHRLDAQMAHVRGLGQTGRAGGVDVEALVAGGQALAHVLGQGRIRLFGERGVEVLGTLDEAAGRPHFRAFLHVVGGGGVVLGEFRAHDEVLGAGDRQAVGERAFAQVRVDERNRDADLHEARPGEQILGPVFHQKRDGVALLHAQRLRPACIAVRVRVIFLIGVALVLEPDRDVVRALCRPAFDDVGDRVRGVRFDLAHPPQKAGHAANKSQFATDRANKAHLSRSPSRSEVAVAPALSVMFLPFPSRHRGQATGGQSNFP